MPGHYCIPALYNAAMKISVYKCLITHTQTHRHTHTHTHRHTQTHTHAPTHTHLFGIYMYTQIMNLL